MHQSINDPEAWKRAAAFVSSESGYNVELVTCAQMTAAVRRIENKIAACNACSPAVQGSSGSSHAKVHSSSAHGQKPPFVTKFSK